MAELTDFLIWCDEEGVSPFWYSFRNPLPQSDHENNVTQSQTEGHSIKYLNGTFHNSESHEKQVYVNN